MTITKPIIAVAIIALPVVVFGTVQAATNTENASPQEQAESADPVVSPTPVIDSETSAPTPIPTVTSTPAPTRVPDLEPTPTPVVEPTIEPTLYPTPSPTITPTGKMTNTQYEQLHPSNPNVLYTCGTGASGIEVCREIPLNPH